MEIKQQITQEQLDELNDNEKYKWSEFVSKVLKQVTSRKVIYKDGEKKIVEWNLGLPTIGQLIEYLGDDWFNCLGGKAKMIIRGGGKIELIDALWVAVKRKLNKCDCPVDKSMKSDEGTVYLNHKRECQYFSQGAKEININ